MYRLFITHEARRDLRSIYQYIKKESGHPETARNFANKIRSQCEHLASLPLPIGTPRPDLAPDILFYPFGNYLIFYRYHQGVMEIAVITESHRHLPDLF